eukprot:3497659-Pyramimonas_sp.AAC.1
MWPLLLVSVRGAVGRKQCKGTEAFGGMMTVGTSALLHAACAAGMLQRYELQQGFLPRVKPYLGLTVIGGGARGAAT